jgi:malonyl-CoA/methylmalonyl-CoA synthetase
MITSVSLPSQRLAGPAAARHRISQHPTYNVITQVTLLAALASKAIAVPLSPAFPAPELQYILQHSGPLLLVSSAKFSSKVNEVFATGLESPPKHFELPKQQSNEAHEQIPLDDPDVGGAGMMLYTSGTTNRPVCSAQDPN